MPQTTPASGGASARHKAKRAPSRTPAKRGVLSTIGDFAGDVVDNVVPNWGDEYAGFWGGVGAKVKGASFREGYDRERAAFRKSQQQYDKDHPALAWGSTLAGAAGGLVLPGGAVAKGATKAQMAAKGLKVGGAYGALAGAGDGESLSERGRNAAGGAVLGAAVGRVAPVVIEGALKAAPKVGKVIKDVLKDERGEVKADFRQKPKDRPEVRNAVAPRPTGILSVTHNSRVPDIEALDPAMLGKNRNARGQSFTSRDEINAARTATGGRSYFGIRAGEEGGYSEGSAAGPYVYTAELPQERYLHSDGDTPDGVLNYDRFLQEADALRENPEALQGLGLPANASRSVVTERLIKEAGYDGIQYGPKWAEKYGVDQGEVIHHWGDPVPVTRAQQPMAGAPTRIKVNGEARSFGPHDRLRGLVGKYKSGAGINHEGPTEYLPPDEAFHRQVAEAFEAMPHNPSDPAVSRAYGALKDETLAQYQALVDDGYQFSFQKPGEDPYPNPWEAIADLRDNRRMQVYPTRDGFGSGEDAFPGNPLLDEVQGVTWDGQPVTYNDVFRAVHDAFGHATEGVGFRAAGENAAYLQHMATFSPDAQRALATETLGQNSWLNYGPHGETNRTAGIGDTVFADQKTGLLPDDLVYGGQASKYRPLEPPAAPAIIGSGSSSGQITGSGVLRTASAKKRPGEGFTEWRAQNDTGPGELFDYSRLSETPDVPQDPMMRWQPARGANPRMVDALADPKVADGINDYVKRGAELGGKDWYNTEPLLDTFKAELGPEAGSASFGRFMDAVAATSPRSTVPDNLRTASYYHYLRENGMPLPDKPAKGYGSVAQNLHRGNMDKLVNGNGWDIYANPKPASFSTNLQGNWQNVTIDTHNMRVPGLLSQDPRFLETSVKAGTEGNRSMTANALAERFPSLPGEAIDEAVKRVPVEGKDLATYRPQDWVKKGYLSTEQASQDPILWTTKPRDNEYGYYEDWQRQQAKELGMAPAQYQASMWVGAGDATGLGSPPEPFLRTVEARIKYTADRLGVSVEEVLKKFARGEIPLLAGAGAFPLASVEMPEGEQPN